MADHSKIFTDMSILQGNSPLKFFMSPTISEVTGFFLSKKKASIFWNDGILF
jgi:hypothetical protein